MPADVLEIRRTWNDMVLDTHHLPLTDGERLASPRVGHLWTWLGVPVGFVPKAWALPLKLSPPLLSDVQPAPRGDVHLPQLADDQVLWRHEDGEAWAWVADAWAGVVVRDGIGEPVPDAAGTTREGAGSWIRVPRGTTVLATIGAETVRTRRVPAPVGVASRPFDEDDAFVGAAAIVGLALSVLAALWMPTQPIVSSIDDDDAIERPTIALAQPDPPKPKVQKMLGGGTGGTGGKQSMRPSPKPPSNGGGGAADLLDEMFGGAGDEGGVDSTLHASVGKLRTFGGPGGPGGPGVGLGDRKGIAGGGGVDGEGIGPIGTGGPVGSGDGFGEKTTRLPITEPLPPITIGTLTRGQVDAVVKRHLRAIRFCYQRQLQRDPALSGKVTVKFSIAADGTVSSAGLKADTLENAPTTDCIVDRFWRMQFPEPLGGGKVIVSYPIQLAPAG